MPSRLELDSREEHWDAGLALDIRQLDLLALRDRLECYEWLIKRSPGVAAWQRKRQIVAEEIRRRGTRDMVNRLQRQQV